MAGIVIGALAVVSGGAFAVYALIRFASPRRHQEQLLSPRPSPDQVPFSDEEQWKERLSGQMF
jgi:hypothetical protein